MNASFVLQGVLIVAGAFVVWPLFPRGVLSQLALGLVAASGFGVALRWAARRRISRRAGTISGAAENLSVLQCGRGFARRGVAAREVGSAGGRARLACFRPDRFGGSRGTGDQAMISDWA